MAGLIFCLMPDPHRTDVAVFLDYQNSWHGTRARFGNPATDPPTVGHVHPDLLGELLCDRGRAVDPQRMLSHVHVYRGARLDLYDVAVVVSGDTDLFPAIEEAMPLGKRVERAPWWQPPARKRTLHLRGRAVWTHYLDKDDFDTVRDDTNYLNEA